MVEYGLTVSSEEHPPSKLVESAVAAEEAGFDFVSISDHFHPWIAEQGHSPFVWSVLGAVSQATDQLKVGVGVTCPTVRMHPAVNAHAAATAACLLEGRFTWGVGTGEALNEHVLGDRWPPADVRLEMLEEAIGIIRAMWTGESVTHRGRHYTVEDARIFDLPEQLPPIVVSAFGDKAVSLAARVGDGLWITGLESEVIDKYRDEGGKGPIWSQLSLCWDPDRSAAIDRAFRVWPNTALFRPAGPGPAHGRPHGASGPDDSPRRYRAGAALWARSRADHRIDRESVEHRSRSHLPASDRRSPGRVHRFLA